MSLAEVKSKLLKMPDVILLLNDIQKEIASENKKRLAFREWIDDSFKAEFINGEVIMHSPAKRRHLKVSDYLSRIISIYASHKTNGVVMVEKAMIALTRNDYEPDIVYFKYDKAADFTEDQMLFPAPDFVVEILSKRTAKRDRGIKMEDYAAHGIEEYWIIDAHKMQVEQYILLTDDKVYTPVAIYLKSEMIKSKSIEGFEIPVMAIFDEKTNIETLKEFFLK